MIMARERVALSTPRAEHAKTLRIGVTRKSSDEELRERLLC